MNKQGNVEILARVFRVTVPGHAPVDITPRNKVGKPIRPTSSMAQAAYSAACRAFQASGAKRARKPKRGTRNPGPQAYVSTYCNFAHNMKTGKPIKHECRIIPPAALQAERDGDFERAIEIMQRTPARYMRGRNPRVEYASGGRMHYADTDPGQGVFVGPTGGKRGHIMTARGYSGGKPTGSTRARAFIVRNPDDCRRCKGACSVRLGPRMVPCPTCQRKGR